MTISNGKDGKEHQHLKRHPAYPMTASGGYPKYDHALQRLSFEEFSGDIAVASANEQSNNDKEDILDNAWVLTVCIHQHTMNYKEAADHFGFDDYQREILYEMMKPDPRLVQVFYHRVPAAVNHLHDVTLSAAQVVVDIARAGAYLVDYRNNITVCIIGEALLYRRTAAARDHVHKRGAVVVVFGISTVHYLAQTQPVLVVGIRVGMRPIGD